VPLLLLPQGQSSSDASPAERLHSGDRRTEALAKLRSIVVVPQRHYDAEHASHAPNGTPVLENDISPEWQVVKSRHGSRGLDCPSKVGTITRASKKASSTVAKQISSEYKLAFRGKCFRCLAHNHRIAQCRKPPRCISCLGSGHFTRRCRAPPRRSMHTCLSLPKPPISTGVTFLPESIHSHITFPELSYAAATSSPLAAMVMQGGYVAGRPSQHPSQGWVAVVASGAMTTELQKLRRTTILLLAQDHNSQVRDRCVL
jgi:hypothetical protein